MMLHLPGILDAGTVARCRAILDDGGWADGKITAGTQSAQAKNNRQLPEGDPAAVAAREIVIAGLSASPLFFSAALPKRIFPPMFNRYEGASNAFGDHIDNAVRTSTVTGHHVRTDLSCTLFLAEPSEYDGGELVVQDTLGEKRVKLAAGDAILYPATTVHRVEPVTRGARVASFFWIESMVRELDRRRLLFDMDMAIIRMRAEHGDTDAVVSMTGVYHNLLRMWVDV